MLQKILYGIPVIRETGGTIDKSDFLPCNKKMCFAGVPEQDVP